MKVERADAEGIELRGSKMRDLVLGDIIDHCTIGVMVFEFLFSGIGERNGLGRYKCSIYCYSNYALHTIVVFQTHTNCLPVADKEPDDLWKRNRE